MSATSSSVMSTLACSSAPDWISPRPPWLASPMIGSPEMPVEPHLASPSWRNPSGLATFTNPEGLRQLGDAKWGSTGISGEPIIGEASQGGLGLIQSGALEQANVDITEELVALIQ